MFQLQSGKTPGGALGERLRASAGVLSGTLCLIGMLMGPAIAQDPASDPGFEPGPEAAADPGPVGEPGGPMAPGEAYATRFSGVRAQEGGRSVIDPEGVVGSIVDVRDPRFAAEGQHWMDEPQRAPVTAAEIGQVFGIALDDGEEGPNVYLTATSAFGLHRNADNSDWMVGMWGPQGGPGTIYKLDKTAGYAPTVLANVTLDGRENTGPGLGNIAYDKVHGQLFVSDLETGMIHRIGVEDGADLGIFDHGMDGRAAFIDAASGEEMSLPQVAFDPNTSAQVDNCAAGPFENTPSCWNYADFRRRVWGVGVRQNAESGEVRLYYAVWSSQGFGNPEWNDAGEEQFNTLWSVGIAEDGSFDRSDIRREFILPDFFAMPEDRQRAGASHPVSDISFPECDEQNVMLVAERGGVRNLGLDAVTPFAWPHESRVIRYELDDNGVWAPVGRYDVGFYDRREEGNPFLRANSAGGTSFGLGYSDEWTADPAKANAFVWMSGDVLCSPKPNGACTNPMTREQDDSSDVHGIQGTPAEAFAQLYPEPAGGEYPAEGAATPPLGPLQSYMIDLDQNLDGNGAPINASFARNDATKIGDIEIYTPCLAAPVDTTPPPIVPPEQGQLIPDPPLPLPPIHTPGATHRRWGSPIHTPGATHRRWGSPIHTPRATHRRWGSPVHTPRATHRRWGSPVHTPRATHRRRGSPIHTPRATHRRWGSPVHTPRATHRRRGSPVHTPRATHRRRGSPVHTPRATHRRRGSPVHTPQATHRRRGSPVHTPQATHRRRGSPVHTPQATHRRRGSPVHTPQATHRRRGSPTHTNRASHRRAGSRNQHTNRASHRRAGSRNEHREQASHRRRGSRNQHTNRASHRRTGSVRRNREQQLRQQRKRKEQLQRQQRQRQQQSRQQRQRQQQKARQQRQRQQNARQQRQRQQQKARQQRQRQQNARQQRQRQQKARQQRQRQQKARQQRQRQQKARQQRQRQQKARQQRQRQQKARQQRQRQQQLKRQRQRQQQQRRRQQQTN